MESKENKGLILGKGAPIKGEKTRLKGKIVVLQCCWSSYCMDHHEHPSSTSSFLAYDLELLHN